MLWDTEVQEAGEHLNPEQSRQGRSQQMETTVLTLGPMQQITHSKASPVGQEEKKRVATQRPTGSRFREGLGFSVSSKR